MSSAPRRPATKRWAGIVAVAATALALAAAVATPSAAVGAPQSTLVSSVPANYTPDIANGTVFSIAQVGSWIVVGGSFTSVTPHGSSAVTRNHVLAFNQSTGAIDTGFAPNVDGTVSAVWAGPTANTVYIGGAFSSVNGAASKSLALLSLGNGGSVSGFHVPAMNGTVDDIRLSGGHVFLVGSFTELAGVSHPGIATLNATTGAVDPYVSISLTGHHNYDGSGATGAVGGRALDINAAGTKAVVIGDFKKANGVVHDQIVMLDLGRSSATVDTHWNTNGFSGTCASADFDTYVEDVDFSPDGSYFAIAATGGGGISHNPDGSRSLCDSASRWETKATGADVQPTWVDYTGNDTFWSVTVTGTAIYAGGHARWVNNANGSDAAKAGAVPRPGIAALDPVNGLPFSWNPGRNPRGAGAYAVLATSAGLYVGSDTDYIGDFRYNRKKIAFFPLAGGETPPSTTTASLPANLYLAGGLPGGSSTGASANTLSYRRVSGSTVGTSTTVSSSVAWGSTRGAFAVGSSLFWPNTSGNLNRATFNGKTVGTPAVLDAYDDPAWDSVQTGSGQTYQGAKSNWYSEINSITGAFYSAGRIYYSLSGHTALYWRYFEPDDGIVGDTEFSVSGADFSVVDGMTLSGSTIYYASRVNGTLRTYPFAHGVPTSTGGTTISAPGVDWRARSLFLYRPTANALPVARATTSCSGLVCSFDGTGSSDSDGTIASYAWDFGDGSTGSGATVKHTYTGSDTRTVTLTVTDDHGATDTWSGAVTPVAPEGTAGTFVRVSPTRVLSTPSRLGGSRPAGRGTVHLQVLNKAGVPASGVSAVVINLTAYHPTATGYVTAYADGRARPTASSLNFAKGPSRGNLAVVPVGTDGKIALYNGARVATDLIADISGYYRGGVASEPGTFTSLAPQRVLSTPSRLGGSRPAGHHTVRVQIAGKGGVPASGVSSVVLNLTAYHPTATGYLTGYADGMQRPTASSLNFAKGPSQGNLAVVPLGGNGKIALYNGSAAATQMVADVAGYYTAGATGVSGGFVSLRPARVLSTPSRTGGSTPAGHHAIAVQITGKGGVPSTGVSAVVLNLTAYHPTGTGYLTASADKAFRPKVSSLNFAAGPSRGNLAVVPVGADGKISLYNGAGVRTAIVADIAGYYRR